MITINLTKTTFGTKLLVLAVACIYLYSNTCQVYAQTPKAAQIDKNGLLILVKGVVIAIDQANKTGNYTVIRDLGSPAFQANSAAKLAEIFANIRSIDLSGTIVIEPHLTTLPQIENNGMMRVAGYFPSAPTQINFEMLFAPVNGEWRIFGVALSQTSAVPKAPYEAIERKKMDKPLLNTLQTDRFVPVDQKK